jgi:hypothetical protein
MPSILENMETASLVLVRPADLQAIYGTDDAEAAFRDHVAYYAKAMVSIDAKAREIVGYTLSGATRHPLPELDDSLLSQSAAVGAVAEAIVSGYPAQSDNLSPAELESIVKRATDIQPMVYGASEYPGWQMKH